MTRMDTYRALTPGEIAALEASGSTADDWSSIEVAEDFHPSQLRGARLGGRVRLASGVRIRNSGVRNYDIGAGTLVEEVVRLECRGESAFGNGTEVAVMNENGGRTVRIYSGLTAQIAYMAAVYRHRPALVAALDRMARRAADAARSAQGSIGRDCRITDCRLLRDVCIGHGATLEGVSVLSNGTVGDFSRIGIDVKAYDFVTAEHALVDNGSLIERCFIGERCIFDRGYTASDSLFFANSHCENGEAVSIFAGPYTVSHHKSSLLIAGMFSFFNAGSGTNQSNHLFKCGAVHQAVHRRGCKFASGAYVMSPAIEGVYTMMMGRHTHHHDTSVFPFSYLLEQEGRSALLPGANLSSYGTVRDIEKWRRRDKRSAGRDLINFETWNPFVGPALSQPASMRSARSTTATPTPKASSTTPSISSSRGCAAGYSATSRRSRRRSATCSRAAATDTTDTTDTTAAARGSTPRALGLHLARSCMEELLDAIEQGAVTTPEALTERLRAFAEHYDDYARSWALDILARRLGHTPDAAEIERARRRREGGATGAATPRGGRPSVRLFVRHGRRLRARRRHGRRTQGRLPRRPRTGIERPKTNINHELHPKHHTPSPHGLRSGHRPVGFDGRGAGIPRTAHLEGCGRGGGRQFAAVGTAAARHARRRSARLLRHRRGRLFGRRRTLAPLGR